MDLRDHATSDEPAVILHPSGRRVTFAQLEARSNQLARFLRRHGLRTGDTVAILMANGPDVHVAIWAARRCGLHYTLISTHLTTAEIAYVIADSGARAVISSSSFREVCAALPVGGGAVLGIMAGSDPGTDVGHVAGWHRYPDCAVGESTDPIPDEAVGSLLQYSAGSTGRPKGIRRPTASESGAAPGLSTPVFEALGVTAGSVYLSPAPIHHTAPTMWTMAAQAVGATTVLMEGFDAERALACIERHAVTHAQFVPTMFVRMLRLPDAVRSRYDLSSLQRVVHAAAPCPPEIKRQMIDWWGPIIDEYYGSSEGAGISFISAQDWLRHPGSVGRPMLGRPHILDEHHDELPPGRIGEIHHEGGYPFEYLNDPEKTSAAVSRQGWVSVGDVGYVDDEGYLYLTDRRHHVIISGGVNVYPQETENALVTHPSVVDAAVFGIPDDDLGQSVHAVVELADGVAPSDAVADELVGWLRVRLARYKCPRTMSFEPRLPRTDAGKLYKAALIEKYSVGPERPSVPVSRRPW